MESPEEDAISEKEPGGEKVQKKEKEEKAKELMWKPKKTEPKNLNNIVRLNL